MARIKTDDWKNFMEYTRDEKIEFVERTLHIIKRYRGKYEITHLLNCCLGLLVLPKERHFERIPERLLNNVPYWGLSTENVNVECSACGYQLRSVIRRIRNGICHFNIELNSTEGQISEIVFKDRVPFEVTLTTSQLKELAMGVANHILQSLQTGVT